MQKNLVVPIVISVIVAGGLGFFVGAKHGAASAAALAAQNGSSQFGGGRMGGGMRMRGANGGFVSGQILGVDSNSITVAVRMPGGQNGAPSGAGGQGSTASSGSKIILFGGSTEVLKTVTGAKTDLSQGEYVSVMGTPNQDGSITANSISIRPAPAQTSSQNTASQ